MFTKFEYLRAFGDSYSDNGFSGGHGFRRYSETLTWVEYLAQDLGLPLDDRAWGGAMTGLGNCNHGAGEEWSGLLWQVREYLREGAAQDASKSIFTVMCAVNDAWGGIDDPSVTAGNIMQAVTLLADAGARLIIYREHSVLLDPPGFSGGAEAELRARTHKIVNGANAATRSRMLGDFSNSHPQLRIVYLRTDRLYEKIRAAEPGYAFEELNTPWLGTYSYPTPYKYLWYDEWHPGGQLHRLMAQEALQAVGELELLQ